MEMNEEIAIEKKHSNWAILSFSAPNFGTRSAINIIVARYIFFYETEVLLPIQLMTIAIIFYTIWDMFNDPLVGHLSDRNNRFTRRWGKRFPWILASAIPLCIAFVLFFTPPLPNDSGVLITFLWFMLILMLFDGLVSTFNVSYEALLPNKFRSPKERTKVSAIREIISTIGMMLGFIIPPLIIVYGDMSSYITMALVCGGLLLGSVLLGIPGLREDKALIDSYFLYEEKEQEPFFKSLFGRIKTGFKQKNFVALLIWFVGVSVYNLLFVSSVPYYVKYIAKGGASFELMLYIPYMLAVVVPVPLFYWLSRKYGHLKMFIISGFLLALSLLLMTFLNSNTTIMIILIIFMGSSNGLGNVASIPVFSDFYDEAAVLNKKRQEGVYLGIRNFFGRTTYILQLIAFWLIHELTGFVADAPEQTPLAQWGIIIHANLIPFIAVLLGTLIFVKMYDLYPKKMKEIYAQLKELKL